MFPLRLAVSNASTTHATLEVVNIMFRDVASGQLLEANSGVVVGVANDQVTASVFLKSLLVLRTGDFEAGLAVRSRAGAWRRRQPVHSNLRDQGSDTYLSLAPLFKSVKHDVGKAARGMTPYQKDSVVRSGYMTYHNKRSLAGRFPSFGITTHNKNNNCGNWPIATQKS